METKNKERPILFSGPMVRAILDGRKTQTRRIVKPQPPSKDWLIETKYTGQDVGLYNDNGRWRMTGAVGVAREAMGKTWPKNHEWKCSFGQPGDRLWVRETFAIVPHPGTESRPRLRIGPYGKGITWKSDWQGNPSGFKWKPSIHMPRWASRITLEITGVRVERLRDISYEDAIAEGIEPSGRGWKDYLGDAQQWMSSITSFQSLWMSIHGHENWAANPWVWVISFRRVIDGL